MIDADSLTQILLGIIAGLLAICAWFLIRLVSRFDSLYHDVHRIRDAFMLFRQRVCMQLGWPMDDNDDIATSTTTQ